MTKYSEKLRIGIIQTKVDCNNAWHYAGVERTNMNPYAEKSVMEEIRRGFKDFYDQGETAPRIVLLPEFSIPHSGIRKIEKYAKTIDAVVIGGCDFFVDKNDNVRNKGIIVIPNKWPKLEPALYNSNMYFGKTYFSKEELDFFKRQNLKGIPEMVTYLIDAGEYGNIGVAICADFYDIERFVIYKGKIHHLIIIAYNKDYKSFECLAEAISRLLLCNVVICNTGHYGNSLAYSPYSKDYKRIIFKTTGADIFSSQVVELPVKDLNLSQEKAHEEYQNNKLSSDKETIFKWPPGYAKFGM